MAARLLDLRRSADLGLRIENLLREPEFKRYLEARDYSNPVVIRPATAEDCYLSLQVVPYGDGQQLMLVSDVSRQMRLEAVRRDFVANASHELKTPVAALQAQAQLTLRRVERHGEIDPKKVVQVSEAINSQASSTISATWRR